MVTPELFKQAVLIWLLFPAIGIPVCIIAHKIGHTGFTARLFVWFLIIPVFLFSAYLGETWFLILLVGCTILASLELVWIDTENSYTLHRYMITIFATLPWVFWAHYDDRYPFIFALVIILFSAVLYLVKYQDPHKSYHHICLSLILGLGLSFWILLHRLPNGFRFVLFAFSVIVISDIMAFLSGKMLAGLKLCPRLSPNKTWAGFIGGGGGAVLTSFIFWFAIPEFSLMQVIIAGILLAISGATGDLFASAVKRYHGIKDFSRMLGAMGGMLDRLDSLIGSGWIFFLYLKIIL